MTSKKEYGDYQTPADFAEKCVKYLKENFHFLPEMIIEPTCGVGNFLASAGKFYKNVSKIGIEINNDYCKAAKSNIPEAKIYNASIFDFKFEPDIAEKILIIGNPPWITNSELGKFSSKNLPQKENVKEQKGFEAILGSSNFDISETIILNLLETFKENKVILAMLCKRSTAINIFKELYRRKYKCRKIRMVNFNSRKVFGIGASACLFIADVTEKKKVQKEMRVFNFKNSYVDCIGFEDEKFYTDKNSANKEKFEFDGKCEFEWRQGIKHDLSKVCELVKISEDIKGRSFSNEKYKTSRYVNGFGEIVEIEDDLVFPLIKSSHIRNFDGSFKKYVIATQRKIGESTSHIKEKFPKTYEYLKKYKENFKNRKSSIYKNSPEFSMFGIGDYSFSKYKIVISGFYKEPVFKVVSDEKPIMVDDTCYFLPFEDKDVADAVCDILNSSEVQSFLKSIADLDAKRPFIKKVLSRIEFSKLNFSEKGILLKIE